MLIGKNLDDNHYNDKIWFPKWDKWKANENEMEKKQTKGGTTSTCFNRKDMLK